MTPLLKLITRTSPLLVLVACSESEPTAAVGGSTSSSVSTGGASAHSSAAGTSTGIDASASASASESSSSSGTGGSPSTCLAYPVPFPADASAQAAATAELATISPNANMTWNDNTGTLASIFQLDTPLPGCTNGQDVGAQLFAFLGAHAALFRFDAADWNQPPPFDCQFVTDELQILNIGREHIGAHTVRHDVFAYSLERVADVVTLTSVIGTYVPPGTAALDQALGECDELTLPEAQATLLAAALPANKYAQCVPQGGFVYTPHDSDTFALVPDVWTWEEGTNETLFTGARTVRITVDPANYTPDLLASDAKCPVADPNSNAFTIGFDVTLDVHTKQILYVKPGLDCIVC